MLNTTIDQSQQPGQDSSSPQQSRTDFQQTNPNAQQNTAPVSQSPSVSQQQLTSDQLRVGQTSVANKTSTPPNYFISHNYLNAAWLWLIVPIVLGYFLFKPERKKPVTSEPEPVEGFTPTRPTVTKQPSDSPDAEDILKAAVAVAVPESVKKASKKKSKKK